MPVVNIDGMLNVKRPLRYNLGNAQSLNGYKQCLLVRYMYIYTTKFDAICVMIA